MPLAAAGILCLLSLAALVLPAAACADLVDGPRGTVVEVTDGDTVVLDTGLVVRLIGTQAPKLPLGREGFVTWPLADEAKRALETIALGKPVQLRYGGERIDRYERALAHLFVLQGAEEVWAQGRMVAQGLARVYSFPDNRRCLPELLALEGQARADRLGIWTVPYYSLRRADRPSDIVAREGHYELVEGRVLLAEDVGGRTYLNFGRYWKEDFTVVVDSRARRLFADAGLDLLSLGGALVRVRGWIDVDDGPRIEVTHPEQIEILARQ